MNSMITIGDTDDEVIDLDSSQDAIIDTDNNQSECFIESTSLLDKSANTKDSTAENVENDKNTDKSQNDDDINIPEPLFKVMFRDESISRQYSKQIKEFLEQLVSCKIKYQESKDVLEVWDDTDSASQSVEVTTESENSQDIICDTLFTVDTQPKLKDDLDVPTYGKKYESAFEKSVEELKPKDDCFPKLRCFNCLENHNLRDCPKPRIQANIIRNRKNICTKGNMKTVRYHLEDDQKFNHIVPGQITSNLRKALGLRDNELPKHIYRMRMFGYPPGWLEEARLQYSGLSLFNSDGMAETEANNEPGEILEEGDRDQYDIKKIYDFPGFNVPPPPGIRDDHNHYRAPKMQGMHSKETMLSILNEKKIVEGYKRKKLKISNNIIRDQPAPEPREMEIEDVEDSVVESVPINGHFIPPLPQESEVKPPEPPLPKATEDSDYHSQELQYSESLEHCASPSSGANSPSLSKLEDMKKRLLAELQESSSQSNPDDPLRNSFLNSTPKSHMIPSSNEGTPESYRFRQSDANTSRGSIKSIDLGTPILQSTSPYSKLPTSDKFSKNISNVINFENLPDSTGKYEQMSEVLQKVRNKLAKIHQE